MGGHLLYLYSSSRASLLLIKRLTTTYFPKPIRRYSKESSNGHVEIDHHDQERAPSTAEEFKRVTEEKERLKRSVLEEKERQGFVSQTVDKEELDAAVQEGDTNKVESVKKKYKEPLGKPNFHRI